MFACHAMLHFTSMDVTSFAPWIIFWGSLIGVHDGCIDSQISNFIHQASRTTEFSRVGMRKEESERLEQSASDSRKYVNVRR